MRTATWGQGRGAKLGRRQPANTPHQILQKFPIVPCSNVKLLPAICVLLAALGNNDAGVSALRNFDQFLGMQFFNAVVNHIISVISTH